jgi:hypothetical protein
LVPGPGKYETLAEKCHKNGPFIMSAVPIGPASSPILTLPPRVLGPKPIYVNEHCYPTHFPGEVVAQLPESLDRKCGHESRGTRNQK